MMMRRPLPPLPPLLLLLLVALVQCSIQPPPRVTSASMDAEYKLFAKRAEKPSSPPTQRAKTSSPPSSRRRAKPSSSPSSSTRRAKPSSSPPSSTQPAPQSSRSSVAVGNGIEVVEANVQLPSSSVKWTAKELRERTAHYERLVELARSNDYQGFMLAVAKGAGVELPTTNHQSVVGKVYRALMRQMSIKLILSAFPVFSLQDNMKKKTMVPRLSDGKKLSKCDHMLLYRLSIGTVLPHIYSLLVSQLKEQLKLDKCGRTYVSKKTADRINAALYRGGKVEETVSIFNYGQFKFIGFSSEASRYFRDAATFNMIERLMDIGVYHVDPVEELSWAKKKYLKLSQGWTKGMEVRYKGLFANEVVPATGTSVTVAELVKGDVMATPYNQKLLQQSLLFTGAVVDLMKQRLGISKKQPVTAAQTMRLLEHHVWTPHRFSAMWSYVKKNKADAIPPQMKFSPSNADSRAMCSDFVRDVPGRVVECLNVDFGLDVFTKRAREHHAEPATAINRIFRYTPPIVFSSDKRREFLVKGFAPFRPRTSRYSGRKPTVSFVPVPTTMGALHHHLADEIEDMTGVAGDLHQPLGNGFSIDALWDLPATEANDMRYRSLEMVEVLNRLVSNIEHDDGWTKPFTFFSAQLGKRTFNSHKYDILGKLERKPFSMEWARDAGERFIDWMEVQGIGVRVGLHQRFANMHPFFVCNDDSSGSGGGGDSDGGTSGEPVCSAKSGAWKFMPLPYMMELYYFEGMDTTKAYDMSSFDTVTNTCELEKCTPKRVPLPAQHTEIMLQFSLPDNTVLACVSWYMDFGFYFSPCQGDEHGDWQHVSHIRHFTAQPRSLGYDVLRLAILSNAVAGRVINAGKKAKPTAYGAYGVCNTFPVWILKALGAREMHASGVVLSNEARKKYTAEFKRFVSSGDRMLRTQFSARGHHVFGSIRRRGRWRALARLMVNALVDVPQDDIKLKLKGQDRLTRFCDVTYRAIYQWPMKCRSIPASTSLSPPSASSSPPSASASAPSSPSSASSSSDHQQHDAVLFPAWTSSVKYLCNAYKKSNCGNWLSMHSKFVKDTAKMVAQVHERLATDMEEMMKWRRMGNVMFDQSEIDLVCACLS